MKRIPKWYEAWSYLLVNWILPVTVILVFFYAISLLWGLPWRS